MKWNKTVKAKKWADMIATHASNVEERRTIARWSWLVLEVGVVMLAILIVLRG